MIKFVKNEHYKKGEHGRRIIITYSTYEIIIGFLLVALTAFYIYNYLNTNLNKKNQGYINYSYPEQALKIPTKTVPTKKNK